MATTKCCCDCDLDPETLPVVTKEGWTVGEWIFNEDTCCALIVLTPDTETCAATFVDGGFVDFNSNTVTSVCKTMVQLYETTTAPATVVDGVIYPPEIDCPGCLSPFLCGERIFEQTIDIATRVGVLHAPYEIRVRICYKNVSCPGQPTVKKYVVSSTYYFKIKGYYKKYLRINTSDVTTASGCCTGDDDNSDFQPEPDFDSPTFWGIDFDCDEAYTGNVYQTTRYKTYDAIPTGTITFGATDCSECPGLDDCVTHICLNFEGVSDPYFDGISLICAEMEVRSVSCEVAAYENICNGLYYYFDPIDSTIKCAARPPTGPLEPAICGPYSFTDRQIFSVTDPTVMGCSLYGACSGGGIYASCLSEGDCPDPSTRFGAVWTDTTLLTFDNTCTGDVDQDVCIDVPDWSVFFS